MKQQLSEALSRTEQNDHWLEGAPSSAALNLVLAAARLVERLLPEVCETCGGVPNKIDRQTRQLTRCPVCHGSGLVWDPETVERIAEVICRIDNERGPDVAVEGIPCDIHRSMVVAVLAALNSLDPDEAK